MSELEFSQVQTANLSMLIMVAEHVKQDRTIACSRFGLDPAQAEFITSLTFSNIVALVMHLGDECLFPPPRGLDPGAYMAVPDFQYAAARASTPA